MRHQALLLSLAPLLAACAADAQGTTPGTTSSTSAGASGPASTDAGTTVTGTAGLTDMSVGTGESSAGTGGGPMQDEVSVGHLRELRGVWVASVGNINFPSAKGLSVAEQQAELTAMLDASAAAGLNAVFLQVRPESDALYASTLEPWSRYLTGTQGGDPGHDPLAFAMTQPHPPGLQMHAG